MRFPGSSRSAGLLLACLLVACGRSAATSRLADGPVQYLSLSGLFSDPAAHVVDSANRPFRPTYELWSDGSAKQRWIRLPEGGVIDTRDPDRWIFPVGTTVWKEFAFLGRRVETRLLEKVDEGVGPAAWIVSTFLWDEDERDATRVNHGRADVAPTGHGTMHDIPSVDACETCHAAGGDALLGFSAVQLAGAGDGLRLADLVREGRVSTAPAREPVVPGAGETQRLYGDLLANCAHCHSPDAANAARDTGLFFHVPAEVTREFDLPAVVTAAGSLTRVYQVQGRQLGLDSFNVEPGHPETSAVSIRARSRDAGQSMPPLASEVTDAAFVARLDHWIRNL